MHQDEFPSSRFERSKRIAKTGLKIGTNYAKFHLQKAMGKKGSAEDRKELNSTNAHELFKEFSKLRGTALKLAQGLSLDNAILPEEFANVMTQAQYAVPPINRSLVRTIVKQQLGDYPEKLFKSFEADATAAASLGQVHKAETHDGRIIAVKIQYPNVRKTIESDLSVARLVFNRLVKSNKTDEYFDEVKNKLIEETDYVIEGQRIQEFHRLYSRDSIITPEWVQEFSTSSVLSMTWIDGIHQGEFLKMEPSQEEINQYGQRLWDFFHMQINDSFTVHADSHPGNYLFLPDGKLGVIDFGCVKVCPEDFFLNYLRLFVAHQQKNADFIKNLYIDLEIMDDESVWNEADHKFYEYSLRLGETFIKPYNYDSFNFGDEAFVKSFSTLAKEATEFREPRGSRHFIYVTRAHLGLYQMLMKMKAVVNIKPGRKHLYDFLEAKRLH